MDCNCRECEPVDRTGIVSLIICAVSAVGMVCLFLFG